MVYIIYFEVISFRINKFTTTKWSSIFVKKIGPKNCYKNLPPITHNKLLYLCKENFSVHSHDFYIMRICILKLLFPFLLSLVHPLLNLPHSSSRFS